MSFLEDEPEKESKIFSIDDFFNFPQSSMKSQLLKDFHGVETKSAPKNFQQMFKLDVTPCVENRGMPLKCRKRPIIRLADANLLQ